MNPDRVKVIGNELRDFSNEEILDYVNNHINERKSIRQLMEENLTKEELQEAKKYKMFIWEDHFYHNFADALRIAFNWGSTKQGHRYWHDKWLSVSSKIV